MGLLKSQIKSNKNRNKAIAQKRTTYLGSPCVICGSRLKRTYNWGCVKCENERGLKNSKTPKGRIWAFKSRIMFKYGLTLEQYNKLYDVQGGCCAICGTSESAGRYKKLYIDHNHKTGNVRSLLCHKCNSILGYVKEDKGILQKCIIYLDKYG